MLAFANDAERFDLGIVDVDPVDLEARGHDVGDATVADVEDALDHVLLGLDKQSGLAARRNQQLNLIGRMQRCLPGPGAQADHAKDEIAEPVESDDRRPEQEQEEPERAHHPQGSILAALQRQALGCELAEHDMQRGDDHEGDRHRNGVRAGGGEPRPGAS